MKKVIELIRVSTQRQAKYDSASIPSQHVANRRTAQIYGLNIVRTIELIDVSGTAVLQTPEMQELLKLVEKPEIEGVVAREFSRIMRPDRFTDFVLFQIFQDSQTTLYLADGPIDWATNSGRLVGTIRAAVAGLERREMLDRTWATKEEKRRVGKHANGQHMLPFGVGYDEVQGWFYKPQAQKVKMAFRWLLSGKMSYRKIAGKLGVSDAGLVSILRNPIYCGWRVIDHQCDRTTTGLRTTAKGRQSYSRKIQRAKEDIIRVKVIAKPLVTEKEFGRVQRLLESNRRRHWPSDPKYKHRYVFRGFLRCSRCGGPLQSRRNHNNDYYSCNSHRYGRYCKALDQRRERLEDAIESLLGNDIIQHSTHMKITAAWKRAKARNDKRTAELRSQLQALEIKREKVLQLCKSGRISREARAERMRNIFREADLCTEQLLREPLLNELSVERLASLVAPFVEWRHLIPERKRTLLSERIVALHVCEFRIEGISFLLDTCGNRHRSMVTSQRSITRFLCPLGCKTLHVRIPKEVSATYAESR
jgi:DNA invertase Pin-like site-specific DNA recombinase